MLTGLEGTVCHADDILVFGSLREQHDQRLSKVLERIQKERLTLNVEKCHFAVDWVKFLGHVVSAQGLEADPSKIKAITDMPPPTDSADVRRYLGMQSSHSPYESCSKMRAGRGGACGSGNLRICVGS